MPKIDLTQEELELVLTTITRQKEGDFLRWKTLTSFLPHGTPLEHTIPSMNEHLTQLKTYEGVITKLKEAKKNKNSSFTQGWFK